jgi:hypothetical protein
MHEPELLRQKHHFPLLLRRTINISSRQLLYHSTSFAITFPRDRGTAAPMLVRAESQSVASMATISSPSKISSEGSVETNLGGGSLLAYGAEDKAPYLGFHPATPEVSALAMRHDSILSAIMSHNNLCPATDIFRMIIRNSEPFNNFKHIDLFRLILSS